MSDEVRKAPLFWLAARVVVGALTPSGVIFVLDITLGQASASETLLSLAHRQFAGGDNLFLLAVLGLVPFVLLDGVLLVVRSRSTEPRRVAWLAVGGTLGALALMIPAHVGVWLPLYMHQHTSATAAVAFLFIPFFCCGSMLIGAGVAALMWRWLGRWARADIR